MTAPTDKDVTSMANDDDRYMIDLRNKVSGNLQQAQEYLQNRLDAERIAHLSLQPNYMPISDKDFEDPVFRFLHYRTCPQEIDNDVSYAAWAMYLMMHPFLNQDTLARQHREDRTLDATIICNCKLECSSTSAKVLDNKRTSISRYIGDTCTSMWTPVKAHVNRMLEDGIANQREESMDLSEILGSNKIKSAGIVKKLFTGKKSDQFLSLFEAHLSPSAKMAIDMSDTAGNMMLCPRGCNATRAGRWGDCDSIQYFLVHVYKYFETKDVRFLNRLFAGSYIGSNMIYKKYKALDDIPKDANRCAKSYMAMLDRAGVKTWEDLLGAFCFNSFCVEYDAEKRPMDFRYGRPFEWDGDGHYDATCANLDEDNKMFMNLADAIIRRNADIFAKIS